MEQGLEQGLEQGIQAFILDHLEDHVEKTRILEKLEKRFSLSREKAEGYFDRFADCLLYTSHTGAGANLTEARKPVEIVIDGQRIAVIGATPVSYTHLSL